MAASLDTTIRDQAIELREQGLGYKTIARQLGVSATTVKRWADPDYAERMRSLSLSAKRRRTGACVDCGGTTRYTGTLGNNGPSLRCSGCRKEFERAAKIWTAEAVIDAIKRFASAHDGQPPSASQWIASDPENCYPPRSSVYRCGSGSTAPFETWNEAIAAAGFKPTPVGHRQVKQDAAA